MEHKVCLNENQDRVKSYKTETTIEIKHTLSGMWCYNWYKLRTLIHCCRLFTQSLQSNQYPPLDLPNALFFATYRPLFIWLHWPKFLLFNWHCSSSSTTSAIVKTGSVWNRVGTMILYSSTPYPISRVPRLQAFGQNLHLNLHNFKSYFIVVDFKTAWTI